MTQITNAESDLEALMAKFIAYRFLSVAISLEL